MNCVSPLIVVFLLLPPALFFEKSEDHLRIHPPSSSLPFLLTEAESRSHSSSPETVINCPVTSAAHFSPARREILLFLRDSSPQSQFQSSHSFFFSAFSVFVHFVVHFGCDVPARRSASHWSGNSQLEIKVAIAANDNHWPRQHERVKERRD
jgi:hypothetical protein